MRHDKLNILVLKAFLVHWLTIGLIFVLVFLVTSVNTLALVVGVRVRRVVVSLVVMGISGGQLLSCGSLGLRVEVLNLSLSKDTACISC